MQDGEVGVEQVEAEPAAADPWLRVAGAVSARPSAATRMACEQTVPRRRTGAHRIHASAKG